MTTALLPTTSFETFTRSSQNLICWAQLNRSAGKAKAEMAVRQEMGAASQVAARAYRDRVPVAHSIQ
jgi:hypothetical protein